MTDVIPDKRKLISFVEAAHEGRLCLPEFQRDFVWTREQVADLLRSVLRRYFVGSFLVLRCDPQNPPFAPAFLQGANAVTKEPRPELLVLDGQQRLTALVYALTAPNLLLKDSSQRRWFFVDLALLTNDPEDDLIVFDRTQKELDGLDKQHVQFQRRILPATQLLKHDEYMRWRDGFDDWIKENEAEQHDRFRKEWRSQWDSAVGGFQSFDIPLLELPQIIDDDHEALSRVCAIFEKLNSTGVELSVYDLLTARLYRHKIRLHSLWDKACQKHKRLREWSGGRADKNKFGVLMLRTLALIRGLDPKPRILINLDPKSFESDWESAAAAMERALEMVTLVSPDGFGVFDQKWLPGFGLLPVLAALRHEIETRKLGDKPRQDLRRWYWSNVFLERYSSAVESKSRKDYSEMLGHWTEGKPEWSVFAEAKSRIGSSGYTVRDAASFGSAVYSGIFCLLAIRHAQDWRRREAIQLQELQDHHIFPQAYLRRHNISTRGKVNTVVNRTLLSDETNNKIKDKAPSTYIGDKDIIPHGPNEALMSPHFMDSKALDAMRRADDKLPHAEVAETYDSFLKMREAQILAVVREACGVSPG